MQHFIAHSERQTDGEGDENVRFIYRLSFAQVRVIKSVFTVCNSA